MAQLFYALLNQEGEFVGIAASYGKITFAENRLTPAGCMVTIPWLF
jgi:hypothetical protein